MGGGMILRIANLKNLILLILKTEINIFLLWLKNYKFIVSSAGIVLNKNFDKIKETEIKEIMEVNFLDQCFYLKTY